MAGRPTKYTEELALAICETIAKGCPEKIAAQANGISQATLSEWKHRFPEFMECIKTARAQSVQVRIDRIRKSAEGGQKYTETKTVEGPDGTEVTVTVKRLHPQWQADAWWLERQFCEEFGLNRIEVRELLKLMREQKKDRPAEAG